MLNMYVHIYIYIILFQANPTYIDPVNAVQKHDFSVQSSDLRVACHSNHSLG